MAGPDYILDLSTKHGETAQPSDPVKDAESTSLRGRPWLAVHWKCCSVYSRIYRNATGDGYESRCPRCAKPLRIKVGEGGTSSRFFEAS